MTAVQAEITIPVRSEGRTPMPATKAICDIIAANGDIIKGVFNGHQHADYYSEILAKTASGADTIIPQYTLSGCIYGNGNALKITVK